MEQKPPPQHRPRSQASSPPASPTSPSRSRGRSAPHCSPLAAVGSRAPRRSSPAMSPTPRPAGVGRASGLARRSPSCSPSNSQSRRAEAADRSRHQRAICRMQTLRRSLTERRDHARPERQSNAPAQGPQTTRPPSGLGERNWFQSRFPLPKAALAPPRQLCTPPRWRTVSRSDSPRQRRQQRPPSSAWIAWRAEVSHEEEQRLRSRSGSPRLRQQ